MKKIFSIILSIAMILSVVSLTGCGTTLKLGIGIVSYVDSITSADADTNGSGTNDTTVAAVLIDENGKIVKCAIDAVSNTMSFTSKGEYVTAEESKTKYELGADYGMIAYGGAEKEWFEQVDAFVALVEGKTLKEVQALVATDGKGTDEVITAGCTIYITDFITALEKAVTTAKECGASSKDDLNIGIVSTQTGCQNATEEAAGINEIDITISAVALKNGKATAIITDALAATINFDIKGISTSTVKYDVTTKLEIGDKYNMAQYGQDLNGDGVVKEWYDQAAAFNSAVLGKDADGISALATSDGYGTEDLQTAGCTINIADMVKAAVKASK